MDQEIQTNRINKNRSIGYNSSLAPKKGKITREKILMAARKIFAKYPYKSASIRMIGKEAGIEHPLINYYFPFKADLINAVIADICDEFYHANISWFKGLEHKNLDESFSLYIDRLLDYNQSNPEPLRIISLNMSQTNKHEEIPGYNHIINVLSQTRKTFKENIPLCASSHEICMYINSFNALTISFLGASSCQAQILGMDPDSNEYRTWVKEALIFMFLPRLKKLISVDEDTPYE